MSVSAPPVIIDQSVPAGDDAGGSHYFGPFVVGNALYAVLITENVFGQLPPFHHYLSVYKSLDNGLTWTLKDAANRPDTSQSFDVLTDGNGHLVLAAGVMSVVYTSAAVGNALKIITFDTGTDTFGMPSVDGPLTGGNARIAQFASGDLVVWYGGFTLGLQAAVIFSAGAWGVPVTVPNAKNVIGTIVMGANNVAQLFYFDILAPGINVFLRTFTNLGVLGAEQSVFSSAVLNPTPQSGIPIGRTVIWNGNFIVPYYGGPGGNQAGVWVGTPYTAPVWAFTIANPNAQPPPLGTDFAAFAFVDGSNNLCLFWITASDWQDVSQPPIVNKVSNAVNPGTGFGPPLLFYSEPGNPPAGLVDGPLIDVVTLSATRYANPKFGVLVGFCGCPTTTCLGEGYLLDDGSMGKRCLL